MDSIELTILYTNDFHAQDKPVKATWIEGEPMMGGAAYMAAYTNKIRSSEPMFWMPGTLLPGLQLAFLRTETNARKLLAQAQFPFLSGSIFYKGSNILFAKPYEIVEKGGLKIGVIGIHGKKGGYETIQVDHVQDLDFREQESLLQEYVNLLRPHVDLIIVLAHQGIGTIV